MPDDDEQEAWRLLMEKQRDLKNQRTQTLINHPSRRGGINGAWFDPSRDEIQLVDGTRISRKQIEDLLNVRRPEVVRTASNHRPGGSIRVVLDMKAELVTLDPGDLEQYLGSYKEATLLLDGFGISVDVTRIEVMK